MVTRTERHRHPRRLGSHPGATVVITLAGMVVRSALVSRSFLLAAVLLPAVAICALRVYAFATAAW